MEPPKVTGNLGDERTIAEIIGWRRHGEYGGLQDRWLIDPDDPITCAYGDPTVDDLLAWLSLDQYFLIYVQGAEGVVSVEFVAIDSGLDGSFEGPTLLAALESAVRAAAALRPAS